MYNEGRGFVVGELINTLYWEQLVNCTYLHKCDIGLKSKCTNIKSKDYICAWRFDKM